MADGSHAAPANLVPQQKQFVEWLIAGGFPDESVCEPVDSFDSARAARNPHLNAFGFRFYTVTTVTINGEALRGDRKYEPGTYYIGEMQDLQLVRRMAAEDPRSWRTLFANMESNGWTHVVHTRTGRYLPLIPGDYVISPGGRVDG